MSEESQILFGLYVPPHPQPLLSPDANPGYANLRAAFEHVEENRRIRGRFDSGLFNHMAQCCRSSDSGP